MNLSVLQITPILLDKWFLSFWKYIDIREGNVIVTDHVVVALAGHVSKESSEKIWIGYHGDFSLQSILFPKMTIATAWIETETSAEINRKEIQLRNDI